LASVLVPQGAAPSRGGARVARTVRSAVGSLVSDGIAAMRSPAPTVASTNPAPRGVLGRFFDFFAAPLASAAVGVIPQVMRESRERELERVAARERAIQTNLEYFKTVGKRPAPIATSSSKTGSSSPAVIAVEEVQVCDEKGCAALKFSVGEDGRLTARTNTGKKVPCSVNKKGEIRCVIDKRTMKGPVKH
jgi:hypothetical protein